LGREIFSVPHPKLGAKSPPMGVIMLGMGVIIKVSYKQLTYSYSNVIPVAAFVSLDIFLYQTIIDWMIDWLVGWLID